MREFSIRETKKQSVSLLLKMNIEHISVSRGESYKKCPYYYKLKYHDKIPNPGEEQFYFTYGKIVHKMAEVYVKEKGSRPINEIAIDVLSGKIEIEEGVKAPPLPSDYKKRVPLHIKAINNLNKQIGCDGITEYKFKYDLEPPQNKFVTGFIDRVIIKNKKAWILDYKTTKKGPFRKNSHTIKQDPQLRIYSRVIQKEFGIEPSNIKAALYYLEDQKIVSSSYDQESLNFVEVQLLEIYNSIKKHEPENAIGVVGRHCNFCEYKTLCPFFKKSKI